MNYRPKIVLCRLNMACKSIPEIRERYTGQGLTYRDFESIQKANEQFDGLILPLTLWAYDDYTTYHLFTWESADDERMMMALYYAEQTHPFPRFKNDFEAFKKVWDAGEYDPGCPIVFDPRDVEEIEVISEEVNQPEPVQPQAKKPRRRKKKRARRRK